jgi:Flp pilus assembly protein TadD
MAPLAFALLAAAAAAAPAPPPPSAAASASLEARAEARLCLSTEASADESLGACRQVAALGVRSDWAAPLRAFLARRLAALGRWDEVAEVYRALAEERPLEAEWPRRLGAALLLGLEKADEAEVALREALKRDAQDAEAWALLGCALTQRGQFAEAVAAFERATAKDAEYLQSRPALQEALAAARRGTAWP